MSESQLMEAIRLHAPGGAASLAVDRIGIPQPGRDEALVRVHAAAITRDELDWPMDRLPAIPSYELSGTIAALGTNVTDVAVGDAVWALTAFDRDGVAAEYAVVPAELLVAKPKRLSHVEAAAVPLPALSAWQGLFDHGSLRAGERLLVTGARGGVGHLAVQLARLHGAEVVDELPADLVFDTKGSDVRGNRTVTVAAELPGATYFVVEPNRAQLEEIARLDLDVAIDSVFPLEEAGAAFGRSMASGKQGKVVLRVRD